MLESESLISLAVSYLEAHYVKFKKIESPKYRFALLQIDDPFLQVHAMMKVTDESGKHGNQLLLKLQQQLLG